jgi:hypothetical protein
MRTHAHFSTLSTRTTQKKPQCKNRATKRVDNILSQKAKLSMNLP